MQKRRRLKRAEARTLLVNLIPLLHRETEGEKITDDPAALGMVSRIVARAIESGSLSPLLDAHPWARRVMIARIEAFAKEAWRDDEAITFYAPGEERAALLASLSVIARRSVGRQPARPSWRRGGRR